MRESYFDTTRQQLDNAEAHFRPAYQAMEQAFHNRLKNSGVSYEELRGVMPDGKTNDEVIQEFVATLPGFTAQGNCLPRFESERPAEIARVLRSTVFVSYGPDTDAATEMPFYAVGLDRERRKVLLAQPPMELDPVGSRSLLQNIMAAYSGKLATIPYMLPWTFNRLANRSQRNMTQEYVRQVEDPEGMRRRYDNTRGVFYVDGHSKGAFRAHKYPREPFVTLAHSEMAAYNVATQLVRLAMSFNRIDELTQLLGSGVVEPSVEALQKVSEQTEN